jgi:hypothetical protein
MDSVEINGLRLVDFANGDPRVSNRLGEKVVHFKDKEFREFTISVKQWEDIGKPTYIVVNVRGESFAEAGL